MLMSLVVICADGRRALVRTGTTYKNFEHSADPAINPRRAEKTESSHKDEYNTCANIGTTVKLARIGDPSQPFPRETYLRHGEKRVERISVVVICHEHGTRVRPVHVHDRRSHGWPA